MARTGLARVMVQRIKALGGTVQLRSKVEEVLMEGRRAVGVRLTDGSTHHADLTVSNVHPRVLLKLLPDDAVRQAYRSRVMDQKVGVSHLGVYIELDTPATCIGNRNIYRVQTVSPENIMDEVSLDSVPSYFATAPAEAGGVSLARGHHVVLMMVMVSWEQVELWKDSSPGERPQEYQTLKRALQDQAVRSLLSDFPQLDGHIVRVEASTPLSTENFTSSPKGAVYGHYHSVEQMGRYRPSQVIRVRDLIQVGHGVFTPGVLGATMSAYYGCAHYLGMDNLLQELDAV